MKNNASLIYNACLVVGDFLALVAAFVTAYILRVKLDPRPLIEPIHALNYLGIFLTVLPFWILIFALLGLYDHNIYEKRFKEFGRLLMGSFVGLMFLVFWNFVADKPIFPARLVPIYGFVLGFAFLVLFRNLARLIRTELFSYGVGLTKVLIVGNTAMTHELVETLKRSKQSGYKILGVVGRKEFVPSAKIPTFPSFGHFLSQGKVQDLHGIIQTELYADESKNAQILSYAQQHHINYRFVPGNTELFVGNIQVELFRGSVPVIAVHQTALFGWGRIVKRLSDLFFGILLLILASPILLLVAIAIVITGNRPVFFRQDRLTRFDRKFKVFKFHTQYAKYDGTTPEEAFAMMGKPELAKTYRENGDFLADDPRVTRVGKFLRATSLDELPQIFNVIKGDISLVGPRALIPQELALYKKRHTILSVKSGITGLAQVSGRRDISFEERRRLDLYYAQNWSFWLDMSILAKTIRAVLKSQGAR
ncbi:MAG TPA: sugar transferase [Nevskiaceae bacterium]|nr:sugar transferase [Nevskiaceae bacterium]